MQNATAEILLQPQTVLAILAGMTAGIGLLLGGLQFLHRYLERKDKNNIIEVMTNIAEKLTGVFEPHARPDYED